MNKMPEIGPINARVEVVNASGEGNAKLYIYGAIRKKSFWDFDEEGDFVSASKVKKVLDDVTGDIDVHINSPGGDVFESIAIRNQLLQHDGDVNIYIDGVAASGASIIATAGKNVYMFDNSMQMIHKAWTIVSGNAEAMRKAAEDMDKIDASVKASYMEKFVGTDEEIDGIMSDETFLTASECLTLGFCSEIIKQTKEDPEPETELENMTKETILAKYQKNFAASAVKEPGKSLLNKFNQKKGE